MHSLNKYRLFKRLGIAIAATLCTCLAVAATPASGDKTFDLSVDWNKTIATSKLSASVYIVNSPMMRRDSPIHDPVFQSLKALKVDYLRYMSYFTFPKLSVAALYPPKDGKTSWDFSLMDPLVLDIFKATEGHPTMMTFNTVPAWMFKRTQPVSYPEDPNAQLPLGEMQGTELADDSAQQVADYYARLFSWYTQGGFTDELGKYHKSGYHFDIPWWEVLNEPDAELKLSPENYTKLYDKVVTAIRKISPKTKFVGLSMASSTPDKLEYFLNPKNHEPGIPLDMISYHTYSFGFPSEGIDQWQYEFFAQAHSFLEKVQYIESIRKRLSPGTRTAINETGTLLFSANVNPNPAPIPATYWNVSAGHFAYLYMKLSLHDIDAVHMSHGVGYPGFFPELAMFNWKTGKPNARYWVLKLINDNFKPGDTLLATKLAPTTTADIFSAAFLPVSAQAYQSKAGVRKILLVNQRNENSKLKLPDGFDGAVFQSVDLSTAENPARSSTINGGTIDLSPLAVAVITLQ